MWDGSLTAALWRSTGWPTACKSSLREAGCCCTRRAEKQRFPLVAQGRGMAAAVKRHHNPRR